MPKKPNPIFSPSGLYLLGNYVQLFEERLIALGCAPWTVVGKVRAGSVGHPQKAGHGHVRYRNFRSLQRLRTRWLTEQNGAKNDSDQPSPIAVTSLCIETQCLPDRWRSSLHASRSLYGLWPSSAALVLSSARGAPIAVWLEAYVMCKLNFAWPRSTVVEKGAERLATVAVAVEWGEEERLAPVAVTAGMTPESSTVGPPAISSRERVVRLAYAVPLSS